MTRDTIKIGTRGSQLAMFQAELTKKELLKKFQGIAVEIAIIKTTGDKIQNVALSKIGERGLFTEEIENSLLKGEIDMAVHSLKDLLTTLPGELKVGAVLKRGEFRDALVSKDGRKLHELTAGDIIATSSLRRTAGLLCINKDLSIVDIRGNVNTRLRKMEDGYCGAMIMAAVGLQRLGLAHYITEIIEPELIMPAPGQGAIAIEARRDDSRIDAYLQGINHIETQNIVEIERAFLRRIEGGCQVPVGCYTITHKDSITITGFVASVDGKEFLVDSESGMITQGMEIGERLADKLIKQGAGRIIEKIRRQ
ncbi:MAG: hydroxymethylbilane synthase [Bacteroidales bacterium]